MRTIIDSERRWHRAHRTDLPGRRRRGPHRRLPRARVRFRRGQRRRARPSLPRPSATRAVARTACGPRPRPGPTPCSARTGGSARVGPGVPREQHRRAIRVLRSAHAPADRRCHGTTARRRWPGDERGRVPRSGRRGEDAVHRVLPCRRHQLRPALMDLLVCAAGPALLEEIRASADARSGAAPLPLSKLRCRLTYSNIGASIALFIALGGTSYGLAHRLIDSRELRNNAVRGTDVRNNDLTGRDIRNRSLLAADFKAGQVPAGPRGVPGAAGQPGPAGPPGPSVAG